MPLGRASRVSDGPNAWVIFPKTSTVTDPNSDPANFTMRPINFSNSIGSRLKQSFAQINNSTPVESISGEPLIDEKKDKGQVRRSAIIAGISVASGTTLLAVLLIGGALLYSTTGKHSAFGNEGQEKATCL